jgi:hypothetical protein
MSDDESNNYEYTKKIFNEYQINLSSNMDYINILIKDNESYNIYESKFNLEYLQQFKLLSGNYTIDEMIKCINSLIQQNEIEIKKNEKDLTLILISKIITYPNVELIIKKKNMIEKLIKEIEEMKYVNKELKNNYENLKNKIELIEKENQILNTKIELIEKNNQKLNTKIELIEKENNEQLNNNKNIKNEINKNVETDLQKSNNNNDLINNNELDTKIELIIKKNNE